MTAILKKIFVFYRDGFKSMTVGRKLWALIIIKLIIIFAILKVFFFPDFLKSRCATDTECADHVRNELLDSDRSY